MRRLLPLMSLLSCTDVPGAGDPVRSDIYRLFSIDGAAFAGRATISFPTPGQVAGQAPCNGYGGFLAADLPQFDSAGVSATELACDDLPAEMVFFAALSAMTRADVGPMQVTLSNPAGRVMIFVQP